MRISKDQYYLEIAKAVSKRSTCLRRKFGAIIVVNDAIVSTGYNGPARGVVNCEEVGCLKDILKVPSYQGYDVCPAVHAEENAVVNAARNGARILGGVMYIHGETPDGKSAPSHPCDRCKRILINSGIRKVITTDEDGKIIVYNVDDWKIYDTEKYMKAIKEAKKNDNA
ncbi:MAG: dCMP deaminase family protein [Candidatus Aenigmarchaeota archaeon]|nr:dCMP deaminase family protein [Candidatus Aenigmarchaeota archaeon]